ncbi:MAG: hypothetical protein GY903_00960 [Fuerstiella sp.]|nr:hypothetical protein [Fuerstiella sp.]MCP4853047.1 hypothetical protein [Fuerstiella sp.]
MTEDSFEEVLKQLGGGETVAGTWDASETNYKLTQQVLIKVTKCENGTQLGRKFYIQTVTRTKMIGRAKSFRAMYEITLAGTELEVLPRSVP